MALVNFKKGLLANLPSTYSEGTFYVTTDERALYLDVDSSTRVRIGDFQEFATLAALQANANPSTTALYYVADINCLAKWNGSEYIQINRDTGMTSVEIVGEGNAVTAASYDAATRKLTLTKGVTYATPAVVDSKIGDKVGAIEGTVKAYVDAKTEGIATDAALGELQERVVTAEGDIDDLQTRMTTAEGEIDALQAIDHEAYKAADEAVLKSAKDYADGLAGNYDAAGTGAEEAGKVQAKLDEEVLRAKAAEEANAGAAASALAEAQAKVASVAAGDASVTIGGTATAPTVAAKLSADADNALELAEDGLKVVIPAAAEYSIVKAENSGEFAAIYNLTKDGTVVGASINIPKDMVVESGAVVENPEGQPEGTYIELVLQNVEEPLYINVGSLIEYVTSGSQAGDMVVIAVSDDHKVTASITDGSITLAKLHTDIQTAIGKAHSHENADVLAGISADDVAAWDAAEQNAKDHADGLNGAMDTRVKALEAIDHEAYKGYADQAKADAKSYADELNGAMDTRMLAVEGKAHEHANKAELDLIASGDKAKWDAAAAKAHEHANKTVLDGISAEKVSAWDGAQAAAEATAKAYTDSALTWGSF